MFKGMEKFVSTCKECQLIKQPTTKPAEVPYILPVFKRPWQSIAMDFFQPLTESQGFKNILVIMDRFSGFLLCFPLPEKYSAINTAETFLHTFYGRYRLPDTIVSDRGLKIHREVLASTTKDDGNRTPDINSILSVNQRTG
jgi:hypothetical protein